MLKFWLSVIIASEIAIWRVNALTSILVTIVAIKIIYPKDDASEINHLE